MRKKEDIQTISIEWIPTGVANAFIDFTMYQVSTNSTIFSCSIKADSGSFFYDVPFAYFDQTDYNNDFGITLLTSSNLANGDSSPSVEYTQCLLAYDTTGQLSLSTEHTVTLSDNTSALLTNHSCTLDRTEYYLDTAQIFWDTSDISLVSDITNAHYIYSNDIVNEFCLFPEQSSGYLKIKRNNTALYEGVDGTVIVDTTLFSNNFGQHLQLYLSNIDTSIGTYLGSIYSYENKEGISRNYFQVPSSLMHTISDSSFSGMTLGIKNDHTTDSRWELLNSVFEYKPLTKVEVDTTHSVLLNDTSTPTIWEDVKTSHKARIKRGAAFVLEYYTKDDWWDYDV